MSIKTYLIENARALDVCLYEYLFEGADSDKVLGELKNYQNSDGGFGNAIEPDLRLPNSSVLATTVAFQYLSQLDIGDSNLIVDNAMRYLQKSYDMTTRGWINIPPSADNYPRAPWWEYESAKSSVEWGNPSAEVLGYILKYPVKDTAELVQQLSETAVQRLEQIDVPEPHEIKCFIRLYENSGQELQKKLYGPLANHIKKVAKINPGDWHGYASTPLTFISSPSSPFANLFGDSLLLENAQFVKDQIVNGDHWVPNWEWNQFEDDWLKAKQEWSGKITVENLKILKEFGLNI